MSAWPQRFEKLRAVARCLRVSGYRHAWAALLRKNGLLQQALELEKPLRASFARWRFETIATCVAEVSRLHEVCTKYSVSDCWGAVEAAALLRKVTAICESDSELWAWAGATQAPMAACYEAWVGMRLPAPPRLGNIVR